MGSVILNKGGKVLKRPIVLGLMSVIFSVVPVIAGQTQFEAYNWMRYTMELEKENDDYATQESQWALKRGYLRWKHKFTDRIDTRVNIDLFSSDDGRVDRVETTKITDIDSTEHTVIKKVKLKKNGADIKLKYAYVKLGYLIPQGDITVGLQKFYFGTIYEWKYMTIEKSLEDAEKVCASADYGVSLGGYLPQGYGTWRLQAVNGEGYKHTGGDVNTEPAYVADLRFIPIPGLTLGGSALYENTGSKPFKKRQWFSISPSFTSGPIDIWVNFLTGETGDKDKPTKKQGYMIFPSVKLTPNFEVLARYDHWDPDTDKDDDGHNRYIAGFNYHLCKREKGKPGVMVQVNWQVKKKEAGGSEMEHKFMAQLRWEWASPKFGSL